jgi:general L-amino acid transport system permease protein
MFLIKALSVMFIEFIRGVPLITLLFTASLLLNYFLPPGTNFDIILRVIIMVTLFAAPISPRSSAAALPPCRAGSTRRRMRWGWTTGRRSA